MQSFTAFSLALLSLSSLAAAAATKADEIRVLYRWVEDNNEQGIAAFANDTLIGASCEAKLDQGSFSISFSVDDDPSNGTISVNGKDYRFGWSADESSPWCGRAYGGGVVELDCAVPMKGDFKAVTAGPAENCFSRDYAPFDINSKSMALLGFTNGVPVESAPAKGEDDSEERSLDLGKRQCSVGGFTTLVGNGNPHQNYYHSQLTVGMTFKGI